MVDYYSILQRAVTAPDAGDAQWRRGMYDRARQMLTVRLKARQPPATMAELAEAALESRRKSALADTIAERALLAIATKGRRNAA